MTPLKPFLVGWIIFSSTLVLAAPKTKPGYKGKAGKQAAQLAARQTKPNKFVAKNPASTVSPGDSGELSVDSVLYQAQKMAAEWTQEVGYLLKSTGPWLREIEAMIRGEDAAVMAEAAPVTKKGQRALASAETPKAAAPKAVAKAEAPVAAAASATSRRSRLPKRQLGQMTSDPNSILETVMAVSRDTWEKVNTIVGDLLGQAASIGD